MPRSFEVREFCFVVSPEAALRNIPEHRLRQNRVTAVFEDSALSFILAVHFFSGVDAQPSAIATLKYLNGHRWSRRSKPESC
jgi:hypothetical protein